MSSNDGVLLVAHGTVGDPDEIPEFLSKIRRGRPATPALVEETRRRYELIGGSPLLEITERQARALGERLGLPTFVGMRFGCPTIETALSEARATGVTRLCVLPMAPFSVHVYEAVVRDRLAELEVDLDLATVPPWGSEPGVIDAHARRIAPRLRGRDDEALVLSAHSLPTRVVDGGDPYRDQFLDSARGIESALGVSATVAFQSQGADGGDWIGPSLDEVLRELAGRSIRRVVLAPVGFPADHVETLYDLDVEARALAEQLGLELERVPALNDDRGLIGTLAAVVRRILG